MRYVLSDLALQDLNDIAEYTIDRFGYEQRKRYAVIIRLAFEKIAEDPHSVTARQIRNYRADVKYVRAGSHLVFYQKKSDYILILRVLHKSMDILSHLP